MNILENILDWQIIWWAVGLMIVLFILGWVVEYWRDKYCQCDKPLIVEHLDGPKTCGLCRKDIKERRKK